MREPGIGMPVLSHKIPGPESLSGDESDDPASGINDRLAEVVASPPVNSTFGPSL